jgi:hypothetical protein
MKGSFDGWSIHLGNRIAVASARARISAVPGLIIEPPVKPPDRKMVEVLGFEPGCPPR